jgi:hypothetical protein
MLHELRYIKISANPNQNVEQNMGINGRFTNMNIILNWKRSLIAKIVKHMEEKVDDPPQ